MAGTQANALLWRIWPFGLQTTESELASAKPMQIFHVVAGVALLAAIAFQVWLTVRVWRSSLFERDQKMNQAKLIWLLPVIGAAIVFSVLIQEDEALRQSKPKSHLRS